MSNLAQLCRIHKESKELADFLEQALGDPKVIEKLTPLPGNICRECGGEVVEHYSGYDHINHRENFNTPSCTKCGAKYYYSRQGDICKKIGGYAEEKEAERRFHEFFGLPLPEVRYK